MFLECNAAVFIVNGNCAGFASSRLRISTQGLGSWSTFGCSWAVSGGILTSAFVTRDLNQLVLVKGSIECITFHSTYRSGRCNE
jgi:hypothetical protein